MLSFTDVARLMTTHDATGEPRDWSIECACVPVYVVSDSSVLSRQFTMTAQAGNAKNLPNCGCCMNHFEHKKIYNIYKTMCPTINPHTATNMSMYAHGCNWQFYNTSFIILYKIKRQRCDHYKGKASADPGCRAVCGCSLAGITGANPARAMNVVLSGRGPIPLPEESYWVCVCVCV
jgi:hypothetical protein